MGAVHPPLREEAGGDYKKKKTDPRKCLYRPRTTNAIVCTRRTSRYYQQIPGRKFAIVHIRIFCAVVLAAARRFVVIEVQWSNNGRVVLQHVDFFKRWRLL